MSSMDLLVVSVFFFLSPLLSLGSSDRSHNEKVCGGVIQSGEQRTPEFGARDESESFDLMKIQLFIQI